MTFGDRLQALQSAPEVKRCSPTPKEELVKTLNTLLMVGGFALIIFLFVWGFWIISGSA